MIPSKKTNHQTVYLDTIEGSIFITNRRVYLSRTEFRILHYLFMRAGEIVLFEDLIQYVWGSGTRSKKKQLYVYIHRLRNLIELTPEVPSYLLSIRGQGYTFCFPKLRNQ